LRNGTEPSIAPAEQVDKGFDGHLLRKLFAVRNERSG
jgi:hypothetical protein